MYSPGSSSQADDQSKGSVISEAVGLHICNSISSFRRSVLLYRPSLCYTQADLMCNCSTETFILSFIQFTCIKQQLLVSHQCYIQCLKPEVLKRPFRWGHSQVHSARIEHLFECFPAKEIYTSIARNRNKPIICILQMLRCESGCKMFSCLVHCRC